MKSKILLIFSIFMLSFNVFSTPNSNEKFKLAKSYLEQKEYVKAEKIYFAIHLPLIEEGDFLLSVVKFLFKFQFTLS